MGVVAEEVGGAEDSKAKSSHVTKSGSLWGSAGRRPASPRRARDPINERRECESSIVPIAITSLTRNLNHDRIAHGRGLGLGHGAEGTP